MHVVSVDRRNLVVSMRLTGFVTMPEAELAASDLHAAIRSLGTMAGKHRTLYDFTETQVASAEMLEHFSRYFIDPEYRDIWASKVAFVAESALIALQLKRIQGDRSDLRIFGDRQSAMAWLLEG